MKAVVAHDTPEALTAASRRSRSGAGGASTAGDPRRAFGTPPQLGVRAVWGEPRESAALG